MLKFITKDIIYLYDTWEGNANTILYIERIAEIWDTLTHDLEKLKNQNIFNYENRSVKYSDKDWVPVSNVSKDSKNSERITLLNTRKNELISLKRKTLVLMNKLIEKTK